MSQYLEQRHIGLSAEDEQQMLHLLGLETLDQLIDQTIPENIRRDMPQLSEPLTESQYLALMDALATQNKRFTNLIGRGYYGCAVPAVVQRCLLENPSWYTSYTSYQAEVSQGRLELLFLFQTMMSDLAGLPLANCSLLDEATAAAEAVTMMRNLRSREQVKNNINTVWVSSDMFDSTLAVLKTRAEGQGILLDISDMPDMSRTYCGAIWQYPMASGEVGELEPLTDFFHSQGAKVAVVADPLALALLPSPGSFGADIVCGSAGRLGLPMGYGGPTAGYMCCRDEYKRELPGRIIGLSKDSHEKPAFRLALQTREQHIKREKATSNICTAEALSAMMVACYGLYNGAEGIRKTAESIHSKAVYISELAQAYGFEQLNDQFFDTIRLVLPEGVTVEMFREKAEQAEINCYYGKDNTISLSFDELVGLDEMNALIELFAEVTDNCPQTEESDSAFEGLWAIDESKVREIDYLQNEIFGKYHTETELMRYLKNLERKDISLTDSMIPLGSCTMKLNPAAAMIPITMQGFTAPHPLQPIEQVGGYQEIIKQLTEQLLTITGFSALTFQPTSGAAGEYTGLVVIREALKKRGEEQRKVLLIPASAHGTNPASCVQAGFVPVVVACDEKGNTDLQDWKKKIEENKPTLAGCMITYPSTHGIFETAIREMIDSVHEAGGLVYMDGANMNAQIGYTCPAAMGADVCHLNLHKSFAAPHGGGGPGAGCVAVRKELTDCLPTETANRVSSAMYGNINMAIISFGYIAMMGTDALRHATATAILSANYLAHRLKDAYGIVYTGESGRVGHELILDCRQFKAVGITETDIAKRLMDFGYHAPTLSFPVHGTLMIEPTESESKQELDRFAEAMLTIREEIREIENGSADAKDNVLLNAPHPEYEAIVGEWNHSYSRQKAYYPLSWVAQNKRWIPVGRVDNGFGDRNLVARL